MLNIPFLKVLSGKQLRTVALLSLVFALFSTAVVLAGVGARIWQEDPKDLAAGLSVMIGAFWIIMFTGLLIPLYQGTRQAAAVRASYEIRTTIAGGRFLNRVTVQISRVELGSGFQERCAEFLRSAIRACDVTVSPDGSTVTARVRAFAFDYYPHRVEISIGTSEDHVHAIRAQAETPTILGCPFGDGGGLVILVLIANWLRGAPLPTSNWPHVMWRTVVASIASYSEQSGDA